jgi:BirA family biotin operon repressor/biotin-[acetyl-CoA-carboxylase] ligase
MPEPVPPELAERLPPDIAEGLHRNASRFGALGHSIQYFTEVTSTNDIAARLAERGASEGTAVLASAQTAGRGRMGRSWHSPPGAGLYVSLVFRDPRVAGMLTLAGGVAVAQGIRAATALPVEIKWPNDVVLRDSSRRRRLKLAGVLAEASTGAEGLQHVILGIGINVRCAALPPELDVIATSIERELGRPPDAGAVLGETLASLNVMVQHLRSGNRSMVLDRWRALAPSSLGSTVEWERTNGRTRGTTAGVDDDGALLVRMGEATERIVSGEVRWL